ncbi:unnamed protein product [Acanthoscelides obtectus]|nr:unnamed protein product [Acanthoscelides obtectus]CAK1627375.1 DNA-(apurinic or apyrimidinic site) lyase [Acanthoscelides obtectus]
MKISTWNVGGLKSWIKKGCLKYVKLEMPDIFCLQETRCKENDLPKELDELENYNKYWLASKKDGYAGVGLFTIKKPLDVKYGIGDKEQDDDGRCITAEYEDYYVVCVYVPNAGRGLITLPKRVDWNDSFKRFILALEGNKPVIIAGDMNVSHHEIDLARPKNNVNNAGFTPEERLAMDDLLICGYIDVFRHLYPETVAYTFWTYMMNCRGKNIGWRLDYFLISEKLIRKVCDCVIRSEVLGSDHCPITLFLNI